MRIERKIHLYSSVLFAVLLVVINLSIYFMFSRLSLNSQFERAESEALTIAQGMRDAPVTIPTEDLLRAFVPFDGMLRVVKPSEKNEYPPVTSSSQSILSERTVTYFTEKKIEEFEYRNHSYVLVSIPVIWRDGEVVNIQLTVSLLETEENLRILAIVLIAVTIIALISVFLSARFLSRLITRPITTMTRTMKEIRENGEFKRLELGGSSKDELMEMGQTFNLMIDLLEDNFEKQKTFVSNASHELRTPLTVIESYASLLKRKGLERPDIFIESIEAIHSEAIRMKEMTDQFLLLARNNAQWNVTMKRIDIAELALNSAKVYQDAYRRDVYVEVVDTVHGYTDENLLKQLLFIFLDNARKYSDEPITVNVGSTGKTGWICVVDRGIGITSDELPKVFDRFYRVDQSRSRKNGGSGLGLSLAKEIAEVLDLRINLDSIEGRGTTATILFKDGPKTL
jgi:two-component system, OmpR family, sensor histidine kinase ArlS